MRVVSVYKPVNNHVNINIFKMPAKSTSRKGKQPLKPITFRVTDSTSIETWVAIERRRGPRMYKIVSTVSNDNPRADQFVQVDVMEDPNVHSCPDCGKLEFNSGHLRDINAILRIKEEP